MLQIKLHLYNKIKEDGTRNKKYSKSYPSSITATQLISKAPDLQKKNSEKH